MWALARFVRFAYWLNRLVGRAAGWLVLATVLICASVALARYGLNFGRVWMQELYVVTFAVSFMLVAPLAYGDNQHVRVDILARQFPPRRRAWIEIGGAVLFLVPWLLLVLWSSRPFVALSWAVAEPSPQAGGLPGLYLVKAVIPAFACLLLLQGLGVIGRNVILLAGREDILPPDLRSEPAGSVS
ncbi:TRAP transporter small permease subunit [Geminicoccaceae bacterium 1502E]|nr:TRAP transporter small permease subunit [Geminicoccaceae bacterium 1502E]